MILPLYWLCNTTPSHIQQLYPPKLFKEKSVLGSACSSKVRREKECLWQEIRVSEKLLLICHHHTPLGGMYVCISLSLCAGGELHTLHVNVRDRICSWVLCRVETCAGNTCSRACNCNHRKLSCCLVHRSLQEPAGVLGSRQHCWAGLCFFSSSLQSSCCSCFSIRSKDIASWNPYQIAPAVRLLEDWTALHACMHACVCVCGLTDNHTGSHCVLFCWWEAGFRFIFQGLPDNFEAGLQDRNGEGACHGYNLWYSLLPLGTSSLVWGDFGEKLLYQQWHSSFYHLYCDHQWHVCSKCKKSCCFWNLISQSCSKGRRNIVAHWSMVPNTLSDFELLPHTQSFRAGSTKSASICKSQSTSIQNLRDGETRAQESLKSGSSCKICKAMLSSTMWSSVYHHNPMCFTNFSFTFQFSSQTFLLQFFSSNVIFCSLSDTSCYHKWVEKLSYHLWHRLSMSVFCYSTLFGFQGRLFVSVLVRYQHLNIPAQSWYVVYFCCRVMH